MHTKVAYYDILPITQVHQVSEIVDRDKLLSYLVSKLFLAYKTDEHVYALHCCNCQKLDFRLDNKNYRCFGDAPSNCSGTFEIGDAPQLEMRIQYIL